MSCDDCVVITVKSVDEELIECPMCNAFICKKNMSNSCTNKIDGHNVCISCNHDLITKFFKSEKGGCIYCGDKKPVIEIPIEIHTLHTYNPVINNNSTILCSEHIRVICVASCLLIGFITACISIYFVGNIIFYLSSAFYHLVEENHTHKKNFTIHNCFMGYLIWLIVGYMLTMIIKFCINITESVVSIKNTCVKC